MARAIALLLLALPVCAVAAKDQAAAYVVGVQDLDYYPIYATDPAGRYSGYARELLDLFARRSGIRLVYQVRPVKRLVGEFVAGQVDFMFPDNPRWDAVAKQGKAVVYSQPAVTFQDAVMVLPDHAGRKLRSLGIVHGFTAWKFLPDISAGRLSLQEAPGPKNLVDMALLGRVDGVNLAQQVAQYHLKGMSKPGALVPDLSLMPQVNSQYHLSSIRHPDIIQRFDQFLQTERAEVVALKFKYGL